MNDERKPLAPDRMRLTKAEVGALIEACNFRIAGDIDDLTHYEIAALNRAQDKLCGAENDAPDDAAWCLRQCRLLCPPSHAVVPVEPTVAMSQAGWKARDGIFSADAHMVNAPAACYRAMLKTAMEESK